MRAGVYLRQSKDHDGTGLAVARQREDCLKLCQARGWEVVEYEDNDVGNYTRKPRPSYQRMLKDIEAGQLDAVVTHNLDRLHRRPVELESFMELADRHRLALATISGDVDLSTPAGRLHARIMGNVARHEVERKAERQKRAGRQRAELGTPKMGPRPFGYEADMITIREPEARALRRAYMSLLAGSTLLSLSRELYAEGFGASSGRPYHHGTLRTMLQNPRNAGLRGYSTRGADGRYTTEIIGPALWDPIVDEETYRAACALLSDDSRRTNGIGSARRWLLTGLALCGRCDDGETTVRVNYRGKPNSDGEPVRVYRCRGVSHLTRLADWCDWRVSERVIARLSRDDARDLLIDDHREDLAELRAEQSALRLRLNQLSEAFAEGQIDGAQLKAGSERLRARLSDAESRMVHVDRAPILADLVSAQDVRAAWNGIGLDRQRAVVDLLYVITLMPNRPGGRRINFESEEAERAFDHAELESVRMTPKT